MAIWTVHAPPSPGISAEPEDDFVFIREGFSWSALLFAPLWALAHRLWLALAIWLVAMILISLVSAKLAPTVGGVLSIGFLIWFACEARDFRRAALERRDWQLIGVVDARTAKLAEQAFFTKRAAQRVEGGNTPAAALPASPQQPRTGAFPPVIGFLSGDRP